MTFTLTDPSQSGTVKGSGEVWVTCGPCSEPLNTQKYAFRAIEFMYEKAPAVRGYRIGGFITPDRMSRWSFDATSMLPRGARLYPIVKSAMCICGNAQEVAWVDVPKPELAISTDPWMGGLVAIPVEYPNRQQPTAGKTDRLIATCTANPQPGEEAVIEIHGPGVDLRQAFTTGPELRFETQVTPTAPGVIEAWCTFLPYGNKSNVVTVMVVAPRVKMTDSPDPDESNDPMMGEAGCSAAGAPAFALLSIFAAMRRRNRR